MRWRIVKGVISLESRLFLRSGYRQSIASTVGTIVFFNAFFGIVLYLAGMGVVFVIKRGLLGVEFVFSYLLLVFNGLLVLLLLFSTLSFLAICSREEDVELLFPSAVTMTEVVAGKLVWNFLVILIYMFIPLSGLIVPISLVVGVSVASAALLAAILLLAAGSGLASLLGYLSLRLFKPTKIREKLIVITTMASILGLFIYQYVFSHGFSDLPDLLRHFSLENPLWYISPATWATVFPWELHRGAVTYAIMPIIVLATMSLGIYLFSFRYAVRNYYSTVTEVGVVPRLLMPSRRVSYRLSFLRSLLGDGVYSIFLNEARMTRRDTYRLMLISSSVVVGSMIFLQRVFLQSPSPSWGLHISRISLVLVGSLIPFMIGIAAIQCFGFEGEAFQLLKSVPVGGKQIVLGKLVFYIIISTVPLIIILSTLSVVNNISLTTMLIVLFSSILGCVGVLGFSMYIGVSWPDFKQITTGMFGSQRRGVGMEGTFIYLFVVMIFYQFPNMFMFVPPILQRPVWMTLIPSVIMLIIGAVALRSSFKKAEELEVL